MNKKNVIIHVYVKDNTDVEKYDRRFWWFHTSTRVNLGVTSQGKHKYRLLGNDKKFVRNLVKNLELFTRTFNCSAKISFIEDIWDEGSIEECTSGELFYENGVLVYID